LLFLRYFMGSGFKVFIHSEMWIVCLVAYLGIRRPRTRLPDWETLGDRKSPKE
jgi:hypothetical protein